MTNTMTMREAAFEVVNTLVNAGHTAYVVGGAVRDSLMGTTPKDYDVTTSATPDEVAALFPENYDFVGAHFGVSLLKFGSVVVETATFREDGAYSDSRRPDSVTLTTSAKDDVTRRDFTVNALLMNTDGTVVDYVGGVADLNNRVLRCVGNATARFQEDPARLLRAVRFAAKYGFTLETETEAAVVANASLVTKVAVERVAGELSKMLTTGHADVAFRMLLKTGLMEFVMPELVAMVGCEHNSPDMHPEGDVANHTELLLKGLTNGCSLTLALAVLCHDSGKPSTLKVGENRNTFYNHENVGAEMAKVMLTRLKFPNSVVETVTSHVKNHMKFFAVRGMKVSTLLKFARTPNFSELFELGRLDVSASNNDFTDLNFLTDFLASHAAELTSTRLVNGNDLLALGVVPGPVFKTLLDAVEVEQMEGRVTTKEAALEFLRGQLL